MKTALIVIDIQNDYFPGGKFPLWNTEAVLENIVQAIEKAHRKGIPVILVQHVANSDKGPAPFFNQGTAGVEIHPRIRVAAPDAPLVVKQFADGFLNTNLEELLSGMGITDLLVCGMMTQNCVTHTAISRSADKYTVTILSDCCTTVDAMIHAIALNAVAPRLTVAPSGDALA